ncbi:MAG: hypothetical protein H0Z32_12555 [Bacillaceae bacterium]|nr:hypothetical protein [Bacillaceae bacterium]
MNVMKGLWDMHDQSKQLLLFSFAGHKKELDQEGEKIHSDDSGGGPGLSRSIGLFLGPALFLFILYGLSIEGMSHEA